MIHFALKCEPAGHGFDGWFRSNDDFERQKANALVVCPVCGSSAVSKALMKPAVGSGSGETRDAVPEAGQGAAAQPPAGEPASSGYANAEVAKAFAQLQAIAREVRAKADYVGPKFAEEARKIHYGESDARQIYGEASRKEVESLSEEGIAAIPLPPLPEDKN